jgi:hypothetical protein
MGDRAEIPTLGFLAVVGLALITLLFIANATLEPSLPVVVTRTAAPALPPNMPSQAVVIAPKSASDARAEAPSKNNRVRRSIGYQQVPLVDRFSIKGY